jgi:signal transduction histidine kinase/CheY-like chemotaxis protein
MSQVEALNVDTPALRAARLELFLKRTAINSLGTIVNAGLFFVLLYGTAPFWPLLSWALLQVVAAAWFFVRWYRRRGRRARGTVRSQALVEMTSAVSGVSWGASVFLLRGASDLQRFIVFLSVAAMCAGAAATLVSLPRAAKGYVIGALLPTAVFFASHGDRAHWVLAGLAVSFLFFLIRANALGHESFLEELRIAERNDQVVQGFRSELSEWLDLSQTTQAFALIDRAGSLLLFNQAFERALAPAKASRGRSYAELLLEAEPPSSVNGEKVEPSAWRAWRQQLADSGGALIEQYGTTRCQQVIATHTSSGRQALLIIDITELKVAEEAIRARDLALERTQRVETVGTLAGAVAHDFNNMMTAIRGFAELLLLEVHSESARESITEIQNCVERGSQLTRQLLAYGRRQVLRPRELSLNDLVSRMRLLIERVLPSTVEVCIDLDPDLGLVHADVSQMEHVLLNLAINARDAMVQGGTLTIRTRNLSVSELELVVQDSGVGMDQNTIEHAFEPFFTTKSEHQGSGLGLAVTHGVVRQSGGTITIESSPGQGALFRIRLPRVAPATSTQGPGRGTMPSGSVLRVLVVDDDDAVRRVVAHSLVHLGYAVVEAEGPERALRLWQDQARTLAAVVTDVVMPTMDGVTMVQAMARTGIAPRVLFMTGYDAGVLAGAPHVEFIQKPFEQTQLGSALERVLLSPPVDASD